MVETDLKTGRVTSEIIKLARDPRQATVNIAELPDVLDPGQMKAREQAPYGQQKDQETLEAVTNCADSDSGIAQAPGEEKEVLRQIALFKAINEGDFEMQESIRLGRLLEDEFTQYISRGNVADDLHKFRPNQAQGILDDSSVEDS